MVSAFSHIVQNGFILSKRVEGRRATSTMALPINESTLRSVERLADDIAWAQANGRGDMARYFQTLLRSKASNDLLEQIAVESIGGVCSGKKLGADGFLPNGQGVEAKPHKGASTQAKGGCINDDSPMKLKRDYHEISTIVFLNADESGDRVNWQVVVPFRYWTGARFAKICKRLKLDWVWPSDETEQVAMLDALVAEHKKETYVRSNALSLGVLAKIPVSEISLWVHPDLPAKRLPAVLRTLRTRMSAPPKPSLPPAAPAPSE